MLNIQGYFDNSATTKPCERAVSRMREVLCDNWGNPSSLYDLGISAENVLTDTRRAVAKLIFCREDEVFFTSGGTESNNLALFGAAAARKRRGNRIVLSRAEHSSVLETAAELERRGFEIVYLEPGADGRVCEEELARKIDCGTILVSLMLVNNETGAVNPVEKAAAILKKANPDALLHCDCVQAFGKLPIKTAKLGADLISVSAHKIHGPKGAGALIKLKSARITAHSFGGGQEKNLRPGTEPVPAIAGFLGALEELPDIAAQSEKITALKALAVNELSAIPGVCINSPADGLPYILNISVAGIRSETMLHFLEERGLYVSSGSACSKGKGSYVLRAMGLPDDRVDSALRISFSRYNTAEEVRLLIQGIRDAVARLKRR